MQQAFGFLVTGIVVGAFYGLLALAMQVVYASSRMVNFAQGNFVLAGSFAMSLLAGTLGAPIWLAVVIIVIAGAAAGAAFEVLAIHPLFRRPDTTPMTGTLCTVAAGAALTGLLLLAFGTQPRSVPSLFGSRSFQLAGVAVTAQDLCMIASALVVVVALQVFLKGTWIGRGLTAAAQNREGATVVGIETQTMVTVAFALSGVVTFVAGALIGPTIGAQAEYGATTYILPGFTAALLGGLGSPFSSALGGVALGVATAYIDGFLGGTYEAIWLFAVLALGLYLRPHGLFGRRRVVQ